MKPTTRRKFLGAATAAFALAQTSPLSAIDKNNRYRSEIGIQLYTLRNQISKDVKGTIKAVADAGYKQVEPYGFPDASEMIQAAKDNGLAVHSSHFNWDSVVNPDQKGVKPFAAVLEEANKVGLKHLVVPYLADRNRKTLDDYKLVCERCNKGAEQAKAAGIQLAYHNHSFEFQPMKDSASGEMSTGFEVMVKEFSSDMKFEVDVFWIQVGGKNPVDLIRSLKGRVSQLHLKDLSKDLKTPKYNGIPPQAFEELGDGVISWDPVIEVAAEAGVDICHVEQDHSPHPLKSIKQSIDHLQTL